MSLFNIGLQGLQAHQEALSVTGDNIANVNTVAFKGSRVNFRELINQSAVGGGAGAGVALGEVQRVMTQGAITQTGSALDFAIAGDSFFAVSGTFNGTSGRFYSRAGQFRMDNSLRIINSEGLALQGFAFSPVAQTRSGQLSDIFVEPETIFPVPTTEVSMVSNLDQRVTVPVDPFDPTDADTTSNWKTTTTVYDSLGSPHEMTVYFVKTATPGDWDWHAVAEGDEIVGAASGGTSVGSGTITFNTSGSLEDVPAPDTPIVIDWVDATPGQAISLDFGEPIDEGGFGLNGVTQFATPSSNTSILQDGFPPGTLESLDLTPLGVLTGQYSNGRNLKIAQLAMARFNAVEPLKRIGGGMYVETPGSGRAVIGTAEEGGVTLQGGALEQSNVDLASEFIQLIQEQRAFSASSRTVLTADEVLQETIALKR